MVDGKGKKLLMLGDGMMDMYLHGAIEECQEGCSKFVEQSKIGVPGGVLNAERSLSYWQCAITTKCDTRLSVKTRYLVDSEIVFRHDLDRLSDPGEMPNIKGFDGILLSDYDKGYLSEDLIEYVIQEAHELNIPVVVDAKREPSLYEGAIVKCNFAYALKYKYVGDVCTHGQKRPFVYGKLSGRELPEVPCRNHVGAGDCFAAHLLLALVCGQTIEEAAMFAHSAGRIYVQAMHNTPPMPAAILADLRQ